MFWRQGSALTALIHSTLEFCNDLDSERRQTMTVTMGCSLQGCMNKRNGSLAWQWQPSSATRTHDSQNCLLHNVSSLPHTPLSIGGRSCRLIVCIPAMSPCQDLFPVSSATFATSGRDERKFSNCTRICLHSSVIENSSVAQVLLSHPFSQGRRPYPAQQGRWSMRRAGSWGRQVENGSCRARAPAHHWVARCTTPVKGNTTHEPRRFTRGLTQNLNRIPTSSCALAPPYLRRRPILPPSTGRTLRR